MATKLVTIKTSRKAHKALRVIAAEHGLHQWQAMEVLFDAAIEGIHPTVLAKMFELKKQENE
jgi:hypothetical protein